MKIFNNIGIIVLPAAIMWGCGAKPEQVQEQPQAETPVTATAEGATTREMMPIVEEPVEVGFQGHPLDDPNNLLATRTIYFDFDIAEIRDEYRDVLAAHANFLANNPSASISLEGHADERGTREYNIGLGDRRANAVRQVLMLQGVSPRQISTISFGEERPAMLGHNEEAWDMNRRDEVVYTSR